MIKKITLPLLMFMAIKVSSQEQWLQPDKFIYERTEPINIKFLIGDNFTGDNWNEDRGMINCLQLYYEDVVDKDLDVNFGNDRGDSLQLAMIDDGTIMITLNTNDSFVHVAAEEFDHYLNDNHFPEVLKYRKKNGDTARDGYENYQRCLKTILQIGEKFTVACNQRTDLALDIVPIDNPYNLGQNKNLRVKVYFMG